MGVANVKSKRAGLVTECKHGGTSGQQSKSLCFGAMLMFMLGKAASPVPRRSAASISMIQVAVNFAVTTYGRSVARHSIVRTFIKHSDDPLAGAE